MFHASSLFPKTLAAVALTVATGAAIADTYQFRLSGSTFSASWQLPSSPSPSATDSDSFTLKDVRGSFAGSDGIVDLKFSTIGLVIEDPDGSGTLFAVRGPTVFSGEVGMPTFMTGTFGFKNGIPGYDDGNPTFSLTITQAAPVPEPEAYALMLAGLGLVGLAIHRRRKA